MNFLAYYSINDLIAIAPQLILTIFGFIVTLVDLWLPKGEKSANAFIALMGFILAGIVSVMMFDTGTTSAFVGMIVTDNASLFIDLVIIIAGILAIAMSVNFVDREDINIGEYYSIILFSSVAMMFFASTYNLIVMFISVETLSIGMYILTGFLKNKSESIEAAMKYFILGSFASGFLVLGIGIMYGLFGSVDLNVISASLTKAAAIYKALGILAFMLIFIAFGFKIAAFPFHAWTPDVYAGAPTPMSAFMSVAPKAAAILALMRLLVVGMHPIQIEWTQMLWIIAAVTMTFGNTVALWQKDLKRLLGYSSISHAGYMLVGITAANSLGYGAVLFYLFGYLFMNLGAFSVAEFISKKGDTNTEIANLKGIAYKYPLIGVAMLIFMFSLAGVPPTVGFIGKYYLFSAAVQSHLYWLAIIGVINSAISAYFYLNVVVTMYMKGDTEGEFSILNSGLLKTTILIGAVGTIIFGIFPSYILSIALHSIAF
ncbi:MAG: NADH-quinone oxidoreductase subunit N [Desulfurella sp.]|uniref:NADH-quinone oxidoreductase subunit N n=2 Tax=Desulfurella sp. TaxID=1962857 RepID=UPI003D139082